MQVLFFEPCETAKTPAATRSAEFFAVPLMFLLPRWLKSSSR
jgi:hypothetical protein